MNGHCLRFGIWFLVLIPMEIKRIVVGMMQTNCYLLADSGVLAVIDPGDEAPRIVDEITQIGVKPKFIINTHGHFDHIGANAYLKEKYGVPVLAGAHEKGRADFSPDVSLNDGQEIMIGNCSLKVAATPGHTPGGICLFGPGFVFSGDTIFAGNIGRTDLPEGFNVDMAVSLEKLDRMINGGTKIYPGHGDEFTYGKGMALEWIDYLK